MESQEFTQPYRHWLLRDVVPDELIRECRATIPPADDAGWIRYANACEAKWAMESAESLPPPWLKLFTVLRCEQIVQAVSELVGVRLRAPDQISRGGGLHLMFAGGHLAPHIDYSLHPSGMERRANLILFLDGVYSGQGGELALGLPSGRTRLTPQSGEAVLWECGDLTYHAVLPLQATSRPRVTAAAYYLAEPRPTAVRTQALFLPPR